MTTKRQQHFFKGISDAENNFKASNSNWSVKSEYLYDLCIKMINFPEACYSNPPLHYQIYVLDLLQAVHKKNKI